jgi:hypothetical protein
MEGLIKFVYLCSLKQKLKIMKTVKVLALLFIASFIMVSCDNYGNKTSKGSVEVYFKDGISESDAQHTANFLAWVDSVQNSNTKEKKSFQLYKKNDSVCMKMVALKEKLAGVDDRSFLAMGNMIADSIFSGKPVNVELTNDKFETFKSYPYKKIDFEKETAPGN